jgi:hypothetical protein
MGCLVAPGGVRSDPDSVDRSGALIALAYGQAKADWGAGRHAGIADVVGLAPQHRLRFEVDQPNVASDLPAGIVAPLTAIATRRTPAPGFEDRWFGTQSFLCSNFFHIDPLLRLSSRLGSFSTS